MLDNKDLSFFLQTAKLAARLAGRYALEQIYNVKTSQKGPADLVTQADVACQQIIVDTINKNFTGHGFVGEEGTAGNLLKLPPRRSRLGVEPMADAGANDIWWIADPIDGTNNFANKILNFAVSIGVISNGRPVLGVIYEPATDSMFAGAAANPPEYNGRKIEVSQSDINIFETIGIESLYPDGVPNWLAFLMKTLRCRSLGTSAMHLAYVAKGSFLAAIIDKPKLWDIAAGAFLVESAGGIISDWKGNPLWPIDMQKYNGEPIATLAANKKTHKTIVDLINR